MLLYRNMLYIFCLTATWTCFIGCDSRRGQVWERVEQSSENPLQQVLHANLEAIGGRTRWQEINTIEADVVATLFELDRSSTLVHMSQILKLEPHPSLTLDYRLPAGVWTEQLDSRGVVSVDAEINNFTSGEDIETEYGAGLKLRLMVQALTQSVGLLNKEWSLHYRGRERKGGRLSHKIEVDGIMVRLSHKKNAVEQMNRLVIWFDAESHLIDRIWLQYTKGPENQVGYLAANVGRYKEQSNGVVLPTYIGVVRSDAFQQFSEQEIIRVEYQKIQFR